MLVEQKARDIQSDLGVLKFDMIKIKSNLQNIVNLIMIFC